MARRHRRGRVYVVAVGLVVAALWVMLDGTYRPEGGSAAADMRAIPEPRPERTEPDPEPEPRTDQDLIDEDRLEGFLYRVRQAVDAGRLGAACTDMADAQALELGSEELKARREAQAEELGRALDARVELLADRVGAGRVLEARELLRLMRQPVHDRIERALARCTAARSWPDWSETEVRGGAPSPASPLAAGVEVALRFRGDWVVGHVVSPGEAGAAAGEVAVEVRTASGPALAFTRRSELQPTEPSVACAADQARASLVAGDAVLAAMWLGFCASRGASDDPAVATLLSRLR